MNKNSKILLIVTMIIMVIVILYSNNQIKNTPKAVKKYDELMLYDFENDYPTNPYDVIEINSEILKYLYSDKIAQEEIEPLIILQRNLFTQKLIELNPENFQIETVKQELKNNEQNKVRIADIKNNPPEYNNENYSVCTLNSLQYMTKGGNVYRTYTLIKENDKYWKIYNWKDSKDNFISLEDLTNE